ncbi:Uncharacterised protein [Klebsiella pneumoniae]|nr:Uncharacterised protein [Klebsiella pneumoniae]
MVEYSGDIGWEYTLVGIAAFYCRVGPPQEMARRGVTIEDLASDFNQRAVRIERKPGHNLQTAHGLRFPHPYGLRAVFSLLNRKIDRLKGRRPVMLRPVKFDSAGDPGPEQPYQGWLNHLIVIDEITLFDFVICPVNTAAKLR